LDGTFDTRPLFTILFLLVSVPVSLYLLMRIALSAAAQVNPPSKGSAERADPLTQASADDIPSEEE
jgi:F0F1-type ATP synthase assembly protein I